MGNVRLSKKQWEYVVQERVEAMDKGRRLGAIQELKSLYKAFDESYQMEYHALDILEIIEGRLKELEGKGSVK